MGISLHRQESLLKELTGEKNQDFEDNLLTKTNKF